MHSLSVEMLMEVSLKLVISVCFIYNTAIGMFQFAFET